MYVAVDNDNMRFLWAHVDYNVLLDMAHIESDGSVRVVCLGNPRHYLPFCAFTSLELRLLYENTTGEKYDGGFGRERLCDVVYGLAVRLEPLVVNRSELAAQAKAVDEEFSGLYKFIPGSRVPRLVEDGLFGVPARRVARCSDQEQLAALGKLLPPATEPAPCFGPTGGDQPVGNSNPQPRAPRAPRPAGVAPPPRGSTRETIWAGADRMWEAAGKPTAVSAVLALRKQVMGELEKEGVKRTSSSNELGNWQKARITNPNV